MDEKQVEIIRRIQKLFHLAGAAGSEAEAQNAALRARELLSRYNLSLQDVEGFTEEECAESSIILKGRGFPAYVRILAGAAAMLFQCRHIIERNHRGNVNRQRIVFIGVGADAIIAAQTQDFLTLYADRRSRTLKLKTTRATDYKYWFAQSVLQRAYKMTQQLADIPQENALVPLKDAAVRSYMERQWPSLTRHARRIASREITESGLRGWRDGEKVTLGRPLERAQPQSLLA